METKVSEHPSMNHPKHGVIFHHNCFKRFDNQKVQRLIKNTKNERTSSVETRLSQPKKQFASLFCCICSKDNSGDNLMGAGTMHATKTDVNTEHIKKQTKKLRDMAMKVWNTFLLNELSMGDLKTNELYYHHCCYTNLVR